MKPQFDKTKTFCIVFFVFKKNVEKRCFMILCRLEQAKDDLAGMERAATRSVFSRFDEDRQLWLTLVAVVRDIDCYCSLAVVSAESDMCLPQLVKGK